MVKNKNDFLKKISCNIILKFDLLSKYVFHSLFKRVKTLQVIIFFLIEDQDLDLKCLNDNYTLNYQIRCSLNAFTKNENDQLKINFDSNIQSVINISSSTVL